MHSHSKGMAYDSAINNHISEQILTSSAGWKSKKKKKKLAQQCIEGTVSGSSGFCNIYVLRGIVVKLYIK